MKILLIGQSSYLGTKCAQILSRNHTVIGTHHSLESSGTIQLDITNAANVKERCSELRPDVVVLVTSTDFVEQHKDTADSFDTSWVKNIVEAINEGTTKLVFMSSSAVFPGSSHAYTEASQPRPSNHYGKITLESERLIQDQLANYAIIRPTVLHGYNSDEDKSFYMKVINSLEREEPIELNNTYQVYPVLIDDVAKDILQIIEKDYSGVFHVGGKTGITHYQWGKHLARQHGYLQRLILEQNDPSNALKPGKIKLASGRADEMPSRRQPKTLKQANAICQMQRGCSFKLLYGTDPAEQFGHSSVANFRIQAGQLLAKKHPCLADMVVPIPESGMYPAVGYAEVSGLPLNVAIINRMQDIRTLFKDDPVRRHHLVSKKLQVIKDQVAGKRIALIDESVLSALTLRDVCAKMRRAGAKEIHVRIPSPIVWNNCPADMHPYNIDLLSKKEQTKKQDEYYALLARKLGVDTVKHLSLSDYASLLPQSEKHCFKCFKPRRA